MASRCQKEGLLLTTLDNATTTFPPLDIERTPALKDRKPGAFPPSDDTETLSLLDA
jgi:hypothetical protein